jgi:hypothetical protein
MCGTLSHLEDRCDLRVGGGEQPGNLLGQCLVRGETCQLALPEVKIAPSEPIDIGLVVIVGSHAGTIPHRRGSGVRRRKALLVALRYRR